MKVFYYLSLFFAVTSCQSENYDFNWSMVKPLHTFSEIQKQYPILKQFENDVSMQYDDKNNNNNNTANVRIVGGSEVNPHSYPYQVGIAMLMSEGGGWCGGSIISSRIIVTAAHCLDVPGMNTVLLYLGSHNLNIEESTSRQRIVSHKSSWIVHEQWNHDLLRNDIGIIMLQNPIVFNEYIQPIRLPKYSDMNTNLINKYATVTGWGYYSDASHNISPVLRSVNLPIVSLGYCRAYFQNVIQSTHICTSGEYGHSTCNGDSGGPLVINDVDGKQTLIGIVSFGLSVGCERNWPAVFTRITSYLYWLNRFVSIQ